MSHPYPPTPQSGYGPPPAPGFGPPPMPPKKSRTGVVLGLVLGVVLLVGLAGGAVWFFLGGGPGTGKTEAFIAEYSPTVDAVASGTTFDVDHPDSYDICGDLELAALTKMLPFERGPEGGTSTNGSGTGYFSCRGQMRGEIEIDDNNPTGSVNAVFEVMNDSAAAEDVLPKLWDSKLNRYTKPIGDVDLAIGDAAEAKYRSENNVLSVGIAFRNGNLLGYVELGMNYGRYYQPPDKQMMVNLMVDIANSGMAALGGK